jgi:hypothetical protein
MRKIITTALAFTAVLIVAAGTVSAQDKNKVEKTVKIVTVDENGVKRDTTIITSGTVDWDEKDFVFHTDDGKVIYGTGDGNKMIFVGKEAGAHAGPGMGHMNVMAFEGAEGEGVSYKISVDGVTVNISASKEKSKEADLILAEVKRILNIK